MKQSVSFLLFIFLMICSACTQNPFFEDNGILLEKNRISGTVFRSDGPPAQGALVWLEGYNIGTYVDEKGGFCLQLPGSGYELGGESGLFTLYIYMGNYGVHKASLLIHQGVVQDQQGDIADKGKLIETVILSELIHIQTSLSFHYRPHEFDNDTCLVFHTNVTPKTNALSLYTKNNHLSNGFLIPEDIPGQDLVILDHPSASFGLTAVEDDLWYGGAIFFLNDQAVKDGIYQYRPWVLVYQDDVPQELFHFLNIDFNHFDENFLNIPFPVEGGRFRLDRYELSVRNLPSLIDE